MTGDGACDVVVIGAGVQGASAAYHLAEAGIRRILVLEELPGPGRGSTGRSGSMLMKSRETAERLALSLYSYDWLMDFSARFGEPLSFRRTGFLSLVPADLASRYLGEHEVRRAMGAPSELVDATALTSIAPAVDPAGIEFGVLGADDGVIDPDQLVRCYLSGARRHGAEIRVAEAATGIELGDGRVRAVTTRAGRITCDVVVNAAGARAAEVGRWVGLELPIENLRRSLYVVACPSPNLQVGPMVEEAGPEWYYRGLGGDRVLVGMGLEQDGEVADRPDLGYWREVERIAALRVPALRGSTVVGGSSGVRPLTPDRLPLVGAVDGVPGFVNSCGWGGEGIMHSPAGGRMVTDAVLGSTTAAIPWTTYSLSRSTVTSHP